MAMLAELLAPDTVGPAGHPSPGGRVVVSRFGPIVVGSESLIEVPNGLLGFGGLRSYALATLPDERFARFLVLQSLEDDAVAFLVQPLEPSSGLIAPSELEEACAALGIPFDDLVLLLIVAVRRQGDKAVLSVNLRAPLFVNAARRRAVQHVLASGSYPVRYVL
ncbi:MAG: flagellar assembly protein FliW [Alphaproteobacteria bacterium]